MTQGGVIDVQGKELSLIGNKFVKAGDLIWTDGKIVFGHTPIRGSTLLESTPSGIPVLGKNFRGYFDKRGHYKRYNIAGDDWIANDKKIYAHDNGEDNIIDAEIATDAEGNETGVYTVEKTVKQLEEYDDGNSVNFLFYYYRAWYSSSNAYRCKQYYSMLNFNSATRGYDTHQYSYQSWQVLANQNSCDYIKNNVPQIKQAVQGSWSDIPFTYEEFIEKEGDPVIRDCELIIRKNDATIETLKLSELVAPAEEIAMEYVNITIPNQPMKDYIKSRAILLNFKIKPDGKWEALFEIEIAAERDYRDTKRDTWDYLPGTDTKLKVRRSTLGYATVAVHSLFLYKVTSDGDSEKIFEKSFFMPLWLINNVRLNAVTTTTPVHKYSEDVDRVPPFERNRTTFPYDDWINVAWSWIWVDFSGGETGYDEDTFTIYTVWDSHNMPNAPDYDNGVTEIVDDFDFPVQDDFHAKIKNLYGIEQWQIAGVYDANNNQVIGEVFTDDNTHKWNMSIAPLKNGYLFGVHDGNLYKIINGNIELVGYGLKNFRLRELKRISKARK